MVEEATHTHTRSDDGGDYEVPCDCDVRPLTREMDMTLTEFLMARIAEDERAARKLAETDRRPVLSLSMTINHPGRLLAECEAKRRIVALHAVTIEMQSMRGFDQPDYLEPESTCAICDWVPTGSACDTLRALAAVYADHPDYDEEWKP